MVVGVWVGTGIGVAFAKGDSAMAFIFSLIATLLILVWANEIT